MCGGKYRTSCYVQCPTSLYTENIDTKHDAFYALSEDCPIWEYDERGKKFPIVTLEEGQKVILEFDEDKVMRERYRITSIETITDEEYDHISKNFLNPKNWR